jgi:site-specific recombinase XerC
MKHKVEWKLLHDTWVSTQPVLPGVWQRKEGGHAVRSRVTDPRTGKMKEIWKVLPDLDAPTALLWLKEEEGRVRAGVVVEASPKVPFATYAVSLLKRKIAEGDIKSASGVDKWGAILPRLIESRLGELYVDLVRSADIVSWKADMAKKIQDGEFKPTTINTWFAVLKVILRHAKIEYGLPANPAADIAGFDTSRHRTYTYEEPNSLTAPELREFLRLMREHYPQHFAMTFMGFVTGLRPSTLRPIRRGGATPDVLWNEGMILIRQSQTRRDEVMVGTKTAKDQAISVPKELLDVLRWHTETQFRPGPQRESILLFPSETGGFRASSVLDKPFKHITTLMDLKKSITPRAMRRSFQDLARAAEIRDVVTRSISGHATEAMQNHYSTVSSLEQKASLAKVISLVEHRAHKATAETAPAATPSDAELDLASGDDEDGSGE